MLAQRNAITRRSQRNIFIYVEGKPESSRQGPQLAADLYQSQVSPITIATLFRWLNLYMKVGRVLQYRTHVDKLEFESIANPRCELFPPRPGTFEVAADAIPLQARNRHDPVPTGTFVFLLTTNQQVCLQTLFLEHEPEPRERSYGTSASSTSGTRDPSFAAQVLLWDGLRCCVCGDDEIDHEGLEAAHTFPRSKDVLWRDLEFNNMVSADPRAGSLRIDSVQNGLILCKSGQRKWDRLGFMSS